MRDGGDTGIPAHGQPGGFPPQQRQAPDSHRTWRTCFRTFALCNRQVVREIRWRAQPFHNKRSSINTAIRTPDNSALDRINAQLVSNGFRSVP